MTARPGQIPFIHAARSGDLVAIRRLLSDNNLPDSDLTTAHLPLFGVVRELDQLQGTVGLELVDRQVGLLRSLVVARRYRARGLGRLLLEYCEHLSRQRGVRTLYLLTTTAADWFTTRGYSTLSRDAVPRALQATTEFRELCPASALCMKKDLQ